MKAPTLPWLPGLIRTSSGRTAGVLGIVLCMAVGAAMTAPDAEARITRIVIDSARSQSPTFGGLAFGTVGQYEKLRGTAFGELDPADRRMRSSPTSSTRRGTPAARWSTRPISSS